MPTSTVGSFRVLMDPGGSRWILEDDDGSWRVLDCPDTFLRPWWTLMDPFRLTYYAGLVDPSSLGASKPGYYKY